MNIFITGYDNENLQISKHAQILGWKQKSKKKILTDGDLVFVYNIDNKNIESLFQINSKIESNNPLWKDEIESNSIIYKNRWKVNLIKDELNIPLNEIIKFHPFDTHHNRFYLFIRNPFPNPLVNEFDKFRDFLLTKSNTHVFLKSTGSISNNKDQLNSKQYFLIQVSKKGSLNILENNKYQHSDWEKNKRDHDHGKVRKGDILLIYFASNSKEYKQQLRKVCEIESVSSDHKIFNLKDFNEIDGLSLPKIRDYVKNGKLSKVFEKLGQQGFNLMKIDKTDFDSVIALSNELVQKSLEPSLWLVRAGERGQGAQTALDNNCVGIGYGSLPGLHHIKDFNAFKEHFKKTHPDDSEGRVGQVVPQIWNFMYNIKIGDFVILPLPQKTKLMAVGKIIGEYQFENLHKEITQYRPVQWLKKDISVNEFDPEIQEWFDNRGTVHHIAGKHVVTKLKDMLKRLGINEIEIEKINH